MVFSFSKLSFNFTTSKQWKQGLKSSQNEQIVLMFFQIKIIAKNDRVPSLKIEDDLQEELLTKLKSSTEFENHPKGRIRVFYIFGIFNQFLYN